MHGSAIRTCCCLLTFVEQVRRNDGCHAANGEDSVPMTIGSIHHRACRTLPWLLAVYAAASLLHFTHNAEYLSQYPNLPVSWTRAEVYLAWCCVTAVGLLGYVLYRVGFRRVGLTALTLYGGLGFGGLLHYTRASFAHHTAAMNFTIWIEVTAAAALLINVALVARWHIRVHAELAT